MAPIRRAVWLAAAVSLTIVSLTGSALSRQAGSSSEPTRIRPHVVIADPDAAVVVRPLADRSPIDGGFLHSKLLLLAWMGILVATGLLALAAGRAALVRSCRAGRAAWTRHALDRGPPAPSFA